MPDILRRLRTHMLRAQLVLCCLERSALAQRLQARETARDAADSALWRLALLRDRQTRLELELDRCNA